jgi:DNA invertase Pin-like site-specific DNA recombinase
MVESDSIKAVIVKDIARLGRPDKQEIGYISKVFRFTNIIVITPSRMFDIADEFERKMFEQELEQSYFYLEYNKKIMGAGRHISASKGNFIGSIPPYGYDKIWVKEGKIEYPTLAENKEQADVVRLIFDLYVNKDMGYQRICNILNDMKIAPPKAKKWSSASLKGMLTNVHYIGHVKWNWRKTVTIVEDGKIIKTRPKSKEGDYLNCEGNHEGIVPEELFNVAQGKMGKNNRTPASKTVKNALASLLYCQCGKAMILRFYKNKDGSERCSPRLVCNGQHICDTGSCLYDEVIDMLCDILEKHIHEFETKLNQGEDDSVKIHQNHIKNLEKKLKDLQAKELSQWEAQADPNPENRMPQEIFKQLNAKLVKEKNEVEQALQKAYESMPEPISYEEKIIKFQDALSTLKNPDADAGEKNKLLKECIERIEYNRAKPQRLTKGGGATFTTSGGHWSNPQIYIDVKLKV